MESAVSTRRKPASSRTSCLQPEITAKGDKIPGNDGGRLQKMLAWQTGLAPPNHAEQSPLRPAMQGGGIRQALWISTMRRCLFQRIAGCDALARLLAAAQGVGRKRHEPIGQDCEGFATRPAQSAPYPERSAVHIVSRPQSSAVSDNRVATTQRTLARQ